MLAFATCSWPSLIGSTLIDMKTLFLLEGVAESRPSYSIGLKS